MRNTLVGFVFLFISMQAVAQSEAHLKQALEGKRVEILIEMPATDDGLDIEISELQPLNFSDYSDRVKKNGIALYPGDVVMITKIKKKKKHIELQLAGGGYGTSGDSDGRVNSIRISKSKRERALEEDMDDEKDSSKKKEMRKELDKLKYDRKIQQDRNDRDARLATSINQERIHELKAQSGSRFNIRFNRNVEDKDLRPEAIEKFLKEYVNFNPNDSKIDVEVQESNSFIAKGQSWQQVTEIYGAPRSMDRSESCGYDVLICEYLADGQKVTAEFVEEILVKFVISSN